ncbi:uncharacterized protein MYCFIDRAFT_176203, partial [Pseudocercospora fijiensis CIRAD86]
FLGAKSQYYRQLQAFFSFSNPAPYTLSLSIELRRRSLDREVNIFRHNVTPAPVRWANRERSCSFCYDVLGSCD